MCVLVLGKEKFRVSNKSRICSKTQEGTSNHLCCFCCWLVAKLCLTLCDPMNYSMPGFLVHYFPKFAQTHVHWVSDPIQPCHPLLSPSPTLKFSSFKVFSNVLALRIRWSFSFCISPSNEYSGLISFRIDWFDLLAVQRTLKSLLQHHSSKESILRCQPFLLLLMHVYSFIDSFLI